MSSWLSPGKRAIKSDPEKQEEKEEEKEEEEKEKTQGVPLHYLVDLETYYCLLVKKNQEPETNTAIFSFSSHSITLSFEMELPLANNVSDFFPEGFLVGWVHQQPYIDAQLTTTHDYEIYFE